MSCGSHWLPPPRAVVRGWMALREVQHDHAVHLAASELEPFRAEQFFESVQHVQGLWVDMALGSCCTFLVSMNPQE